MFNVVFLWLYCVVILNVVLLNVIMLIVVAPINHKTGVYRMFSQKYYCDLESINITNASK